MRKRIIAWGLLLMGTLATVIIAKSMGDELPITTIVGAFAAAVATVLLVKILKEDYLYYSILVFVFFASPIGSVINLYRKMDSYDKVVHFFSGLLLALIGTMLARYLMMRVGCTEDALKNYSLIILIVGFLTASASAGIWAIFEYTADKLAGGGMQRGMIDTLTDMIAGNLGGLAFCLGSVLKERTK